MVRGKLDMLSLLLHRLVVGAAWATIAVSASLLVVFAAFADATTGYTSGVLPIQFYRELEGDRLEDYTGLFAVAHNSGDRVESANRALAYGADIIEIDVVALDDQLYAAHQAPVPFLGPQVFRGPKLEEIWAVATLADVVKLDLKQSSPRFLDLLGSFLDKHGEDHQILIASGDVEALRTLAERWPDAFRVLSVPAQEVMETLQADPELVALIDGVTIREQLLEPEIATWLETQDLFVLAWTVNDLERVNALIALGVDGITTDNLALMRLLGGGRPRELPLAHRQPTLGPAHELGKDETKDESDEARAGERPPQSDLHPPNEQPHLDQFEVVHNDPDESGKHDRDEEQTERPPRPAMAAVVHDLHLGYPPSTAVTRSSSVRSKGASSPRRRPFIVCRIASPSAPSLSGVKRSAISSHANTG